MSPAPHLPRRRGDTEESTQKRRLKTRGPQFWQWYCIGGFKFLCGYKLFKGQYCTGNLSIDAYNLIAFNNIVYSSRYLCKYFGTLLCNTTRQLFLPANVFFDVFRKKIYSFRSFWSFCTAPNLYFLQQRTAVCHGHGPWWKFRKIFTLSYATLDYDFEVSTPIWKQGC